MIGGGGGLQHNQIAPHRKMWMPQMRLRMFSGALPLARFEFDWGISVQFTGGLGPGGTCAYVGIKKKKSTLCTGICFFFLFFYVQVNHVKMGRNTARYTTRKVRLSKTMMTTTKKKFDNVESALQNRKRLSK